jgi:outer membrane biosynthesis protein TonB
MMGWRAYRKRPEGLGAGFTGSLLAHGLVVAAFILVTRQPASLGTVYAVKLVAAPAAPPETRRAAPEATPRPQERTAPVKPPTRTARQAPPTKATPNRQTEAPPETRSTERPNPGETPSTGTHVANVETPGAQFPYPEYLERIVNEIYRRWQRPIGTSALRTQIQFAISRDGTVRGIRVVNRSRSYSFDLGAQGAVEAAANARAFGPLPEGFKSDVLEIALWFVPIQRDTP